MKIDVTRNEWSTEHQRRRLGIKDGKISSTLVVHWPAGLHPKWQDPEAELRAHTDYHLSKVPQWRFLAYNWAIDRGGLLYECRGDDYQNGANTPVNASTESVLMLGTGTLPGGGEQGMTKVQSDRLFKLITEDFQAVKLHKEVSNTGTVCPGTSISLEVEEMRDTMTGPPVRAPFPGTLRKDNTTKIIRSWQNELNIFEDADLATDGIYGPKTEAAANQVLAKHNADTFGGTVHWSLIGKDPVPVTPPPVDNGIIDDLRAELAAKKIELGGVSELFAAAADRADKAEMMIARIEGVLRGHTL